MASERHHAGERRTREKRPPCSIGGLLLLVAVLTPVAGIAIPGLLRARIASNDTSVIGTLRTLSTSQSAFQSAAIVDVDGDGAGEFGWLQELGGATPCREPGGALSAAPTSPAFITSVLGTTARDHGVAQKSGYAFLVYLPVAGGKAVAEASPFVITGPADANWQEVAFTCYAFPLSLGNSGRRAFVVNQQGEVFATANADAQRYRHGPRGPNHPSAGAAMFPLGDRPRRFPFEPMGSLPDRITVYEWSPTDGSVPKQIQLEGKRGDGHEWIPAGN